MRRRSALPAPTVKAMQLLARYGLRAADVPASTGRLSARDVEAHVDRYDLVPIAATSHRSAPLACRR